MNSIFSIALEGETNDRIRAFCRSMGCTYDHKNKIWFMPCISMGELRDLMKLCNRKKTEITCNVQGIV